MSKSKHVYIFTCVWICIILLLFKHGQVCSDLQPKPPEDYNNPVRDSIEQDIVIKVKFEPLQCDARPFHAKLCAMFIFKYLNNIQRKEDSVLGYVKNTIKLRHPCVGTGRAPHRQLFLRFDSRK